MTSAGRGAAAAEEDVVVMPSATIPGGGTPLGITTPVAAGADDRTPATRAGEPTSSSFVFRRRRRSAGGDDGSAPAGSSVAAEVLGASGLDRLSATLNGAGQGWDEPDDCSDRECDKRCRPPKAAEITSRIDAARRTSNVTDRLSCVRSCSTLEWRSCGIAFLIRCARSGGGVGSGAMPSFRWSAALRLRVIGCPCRA